MLTSLVLGLERFFFRHRLATLGVLALIGGGFRNDTRTQRQAFTNAGTFQQGVFVIVDIDHHFGMCHGTPQILSIQAAFRPHIKVIAQHLEKGLSSFVFQIPIKQHIACALAF